MNMHSEASFKKIYKIDKKKQVEWTGGFRYG